jgi:hypothetical protein
MSESTGAAVYLSPTTTARRTYMPVTGARGGLHECNSLS